MSINPLNDISRVYLDQIAEASGAGEEHEYKYKKSGKKSKDYDGDGEVEDESDEYAGVKDNAIKKATGKVCKECGKKKCECDDDDDDEDMNEAVHATSKQMHSPHEVPSKNLKGLVSKAVKRIDTDVDGDTDDNDKAKGELGEFVPGVGNKRLYSTTKTTTAKESFSNWRGDLIEVADKQEDEQLKEMPKNKTNNIKINPVLGEAISSIGGIVLEEIEYENNGPVDIFEDFCDAEIYHMDDDFIYDIVEEAIVELLDEGYDLDYIVESIVESVDTSLQVLEEGVAETAARKRGADVRRTQLRTRARTLRPDPATLRRNARLRAVNSAAKDIGNKLKSGVKKVGKGGSYAAGYAAGATVRGARAIARKAGEGFKRGIEGSGSSSGSQQSSGSSSGSGSSGTTRSGWRMVNRDTFPQWQRVGSGSSSGSQQSSGTYRNVGVGRRETVSSDSQSSSETQPRKRSLLRKIGSGLKSAIKGTVRVGARAAEVGAGAVAAGARHVRKKMSEEFILESSQIAAEYFYEQGLNEDGVDILIEELGLDEFAEFVFDLSEEMVLTEARRGGVRVEPVTKTGKSVGSLKGGAKTSAINRLRKEKQARREAEAKTSTSKPSGFKSFSQSVAAKKPQRVAAVASAKKQQPKKKGFLDRVAGAVLTGMERHQQATAAARQAFDKGMERHRAATKTASDLASQTAQTVSKAGKVAAKGASEFGKGVSSGVKSTTTAAKKVKTALNAGYELEGDLVDEEESYMDYAKRKEKERKDTRLTVTRADRAANTPAYKKYKKGDERYKASPNLGEENIDEKITAKTDMGDAIKDFYASKSPQLAGRTKEERRKAAIAAVLTARRGGKGVDESIAGEVMLTPQEASLQKKSAQIDRTLAALRAKKVTQQVQNSKKQQQEMG